MNESMLQFYIREAFDNQKGGDADYLLIIATNNIDHLIYNQKQLGWSTVPCDGYWETIEEAIEKMGEHWTTIQVYDLYSPFEFALVKTFSRNVGN